MSSPLYKVVIKTKEPTAITTAMTVWRTWIAAPVLTGVTRGPPAPQLNWPCPISGYIRQTVDQYLAVERITQLDSAREELAEQNREDHLLNVYVEYDEEQGMVTATYVFDDRNTALLFKLSR